MVNAVLPLTLAAIPCYVFAWRSAWRDRHGTALALLLAGGLLLRIGVALDPLLHPWDERYHALVAKNLMDDPLKPVLYAHPVLPYDATSWVAGHVWLHKPPFPLWCMAGSMKLFGVNEVAVRLPSLIITTLGIWMCFTLVASLWGRRTGFVAAFLFSIQGAVIEFGSGRIATDHVDTMLFVLVSASILCCVRYRDRGVPWLLVASGILLGLAVLTKWWLALMALPVQWLFLLDGSGRNWMKASGRGLVLLAIALLVCLPWMLHARSAYPDMQEAMERSALQRMHIVMDGQGDGLLYYFDRLRVRYGDLVYLPCLWFIGATVRKRRNSDRWAVLCWFLLPYLLFSCFATKMQGYVFPCTMPILAITAVYWTRLEQRYREHGRWRRPQLVVLIALLALPVRYTLERLKPFQEQDHAYAIKERIRSLNGTSIVDSTIVIGPYPMETMFYTGFTAYSEPSGQDVKRLEDAGYRILTFADGE